MTLDTTKKKNSNNPKLIWDGGNNFYNKNFSIDLERGRCGVCCNKEVV